MGHTRAAYLFLAVGVLAASQSGNIIRMASAPAVAIAAWRLLMAASLLRPLCGRSLQLKSLSVRQGFGLTAVGVLLALHFLTWIEAVQQTTVANAALVFSIHPVLTAVGGLFLLRETLEPRLVVGLVLAMAGVAVVGAGDLSLAAEGLRGDGLALLSAALFSGYMLAGRRLRAGIDNNRYVVIVYGTAGLTAGLVLVGSGLPIVQYSARDWSCFVLMALVPTCIGHTSFNYALRYLPAAKVSIVSLAEPLFAGLVARFAFGEAITTGMVAGYAVICLAVLVLVSELVPRKPGKPVVEQASP